MRYSKKNKFYLFFYYFDALFNLIWVLIRHPKRNIYLFQWEGLGDLSIALSYVPANMEITKRSAFFCLYKKHQKYVRFFPFITSNIRYYDFQLLDNMCVLSLRLFKKSNRLYVLNPNNHIDIGRYSYEEIAKYGWGEFTRDYILHITPEKEVNIFYPKETNEAKDIYISDNAVLVNSISFTAPELDKSLLSMIGQCLENKGYKVYVNNSSSQDSFYPPLDDLLKNAHKFKYIISLRSGLLDFLSGKNKNIIAINTTDEKWFYERYNLSFWKNNGKTLSYKNNDELYKEINNMINVLS